MYDFCMYCIQEHRASAFEPMTVERDQSVMNLWSSSILLLNPPGRKIQPQVFEPVHVHEPSYALFFGQKYNSTFSRLLYKFMIV